MSETPKKLQITMETIRMLDALTEDDLRAVVTATEPKDARRRPNWSFDSCPDTIGACRSFLC
jgi:hypothetical protein